MVLYMGADNLTDIGHIEGLPTALETLKLRGIRTQNPYLEDWTSDFPDHYSQWMDNTVIKNEVVPRLGTNALQMNVTSAASQSGVRFNTSLGADVPNVEFVTITVDVMVTSGTFAGAGVLLDWTGIGGVGANTGTYRTLVHLQDKIPNPVLGQWYSVAATVQRPSGTYPFEGYTGFFMANYSVLNGSGVKTIHLDRLSFKEATDGEILAYKAVPSAYFSDVLSRRQQAEYRWGSVSERNAETGMRHGDEGYTAVNKETHRYDGSTWKLWHKDETSVSPTFAGGVTVGNGTIDASWSAHSGLAVLNFKFTLGSTSAIGGDIRINLPAASPTTRVLWGNGGRMTDASAGMNVDVIVLVSGSFVIVRPIRASGSYADQVSVSGSVPFTWTTWDSFEFTVQWIL